MQELSTYTFPDGQQVITANPLQAFFTYNQAKMSGIGSFGFQNQDPVTETFCQDQNGNRFSFNLSVTDNKGQNVKI